ncbi:hypothetical protein J4Q44_G00017870 [Coregonus suidteri]|uniref:Uncharacterized protein n=1 Tax=Coregonus suidteri TaxID=861788 RepID=A0AAN8MFS7_9TELE
MLRFFGNSHSLGHTAMFKPLRDTVLGPPNLASIEEIYKQYQLFPTITLQLSISSTSLILAGQHRSIKTQRTAHRNASESVRTFCVTLPGDLWLLFPGSFS